MYAAWNGFDSPLRKHGALASCANGGHRLFWTVDAQDGESALSQLPPPQLPDLTKIPPPQMPPRVIPLMCGPQITPFFTPCI